MDAWDLATLERDRAAAGRLYHEFLSVPDLSGGLYVLEAGAIDPQSPHTEDEVYYVVSGRATVNQATITGGGIFSNACLKAGGSVDVDVSGGTGITCVGEGCYSESGNQRRLR